MVLHHLRILCSSIVLMTSLLTAEDVSMTVQQQDAETYTAHITMALHPQELLFKDSIMFSLDHPYARLSSWSVDQHAQPIFDSSFQETKQSYTGTVTFNLIIKVPAHQDFSDALVYLRYLLNSSKNVQEHIFPIAATDPEDQPEYSPETQNMSLPQDYEKKSMLRTLNDGVVTFITSLQITIAHWTDDIIAFMTQSSSFALQLLLVLLLGILMSLTPCLYPMIPITIGVLQATNGAKKTWFKNFLIAAAYTTGMSTTFALIGLLAATGTARFGQFLGNPFFIVLLIAFLAYMGCSMFGWYELYIPSFLQPRQRAVKGGSVLSTFIFGMLSGTFASPCLSPGLALVLSLIATSHVTQAFLTLFVFGIGSSLPLLIIGTFSNAITMLPRSGMWMVEVKKIFGFMLLGMCIYYAQSLFPWHVILWLSSLFFLSIGVYYIVSVDNYRKKISRRLLYLFGILCIVISMLLIVHAYRANSRQEASLWQKNYEQARSQAVAENKKLLLDFTARWCSSCHELQKKILANLPFDQLNESLIPVIVDCTNLTAEPCASLQEKYAVRGLPTIILADPTRETMLQHWGSELLDGTVCDFVIELKQLLEHHEH